jgi:hypothetical protein
LKIYAFSFCIDTASQFVQQVLPEDSLGNIYEPREMSYEGRYMAVPPSEKALSKLGLEVIARK